MYDESYLESLPHGEDRLAYLRKCIAEADNAHDKKSSFGLRHDYIDEAVFYDDSFKAYVIFPEYMKLFDENPGIASPTDFIIPFKWIVENCADYYQITREQIERYFERFAEYLNKYGFTMRTYYLKKYKVYRDIDEKTALEAYDEFDKYDRTYVSDCAACEASERAKKLIHFGDIGTAVKMLNKMISDDMSCAEVPQVTYGAFAYEFAKRGAYSEAQHYVDLMLPMIKGNEVGFLREIGMVMSVMSLTAPQHAYEMFAYNAGNYSNSKTPAVRFQFALGAYRLFARLEKEGVSEIRPHLSPDFELFSTDGIYDTAKLKEYFYNTADDIAKKFDERNGNTIYSDELAFVFPEAPECEFELPIHGSITPENGAVGVLYRCRDAAPSFDIIGKVTGERLGLTDIKISAVDDDRAYIAGSDEKHRQYNYRVMYDTAPDIMENYPYMIGNEKFGDIEEYKTILVFISDNIAADRYEDMRMLFAAADALNTDGAEILYSFPCNKWHFSRRIKYSAMSRTAPIAACMTRIERYISHSAPDKYDIVTAGLKYFGSRELAVCDVAEEDCDYVLWFLDRLIEAISFDKLPDEGVTMNCGFEYNKRSHIRLKWRPVCFAEDGEVYAEPLLLLSSRRKKGRTVTELSEDDRSKITVRRHRCAYRLEESRSRSLYPYARDYFNTHDCKLTVGTEYTDNSGVVIYPDAELQKGGETGVVINSHFANLKDGTVIYIDPKDVYWFCIEEDGEKFEADDLWTLFED